VNSPTTSETAPVETIRPTAEIISFPVRPQPVEPQTGDRLVRALESLNAAMLEQRAALAVWRGALNELKTTATGLSESLHQYRANLRSLGSSVNALQSKSQSLQQWADSVAVAEET
jgi:hypothetical protein